MLVIFFLFLQNLIADQPSPILRPVKDRTSKQPTDSNNNTLLNPGKSREPKRSITIPAQDISKLAKNSENQKYKIKDNGNIFGCTDFKMDSEQINHMVMKGLGEILNKTQNEKAQKKGNVGSFTLEEPDRKNLTFQETKIQKKKIRQKNGENFIEETFNHLVRDNLIDEEMKTDSSNQKPKYTRKEGKSSTFSAYSTFKEKKVDDSSKTVQVSVESDKKHTAWLDKKEASSPRLLRKKEITSSNTITPIMIKSVSFKNKE